jgi:bile acid:Na+ symporter, BASS family
MLAPLAAINRRAAPLLAAALFIGIAAPSLASAARPLLGLAVMLLFTTVLLRIDWPRVLVMLRRPVLPAVTLLWLLVVLPVAAAWAIAPLGLPPALVTVIVLTASSPVLVSVPAFAMLIGLDATLPLVLTVASSFVVPLIQPPLALWLLGIDLPLGVGELMARLAGFMLATGAVALAAYRLAGRARIERWNQPLGGLGVLMLILFGVGVVDGFTAVLVADPLLVLTYVALTIATSVALQLIGALSFWPMGRSVALAAALASGQRNMAILLAVLGDRASPEFLLWLACNQFPIFFFPAAMGPIYRRLLKSRTS